MKAKQQRGQFEFSAANLMSVIDSRLQAYPQIEALLLEGVSAACNRLGDFLAEVQTQIEKRTSELQVSSKSSTRKIYSKKTKLQSQQQVESATH